MIIACLDTETTGFVEPDHRLVEVYLDLFDTRSRKKVFTFERRINPKRPIPAEAQRVHGIGLSDVAMCPDWEQIGPTVHAILSKAQLAVAHNADFDAGFLDMEFKRIGLPGAPLPFFCTMANGIWAAPTGKKPSLKELCFACDVSYDDALAHAANYDVRQMTECLFRGMDWGFFDLAPAQTTIQAA